MLKQAKFYFKNFMRKQGDFKKFLIELENSQHYSEDEITALHDEKLKQTITYCYNNVPYYKDLFDELNLKPEDIKTKKDLEKLPFMDKHVLRENFNLLRSKKIPKFLCSIGSSSGTTGTPVKIARDYHNINFENAILWRFWKSCGDLGYKRLTLRGEMIFPLSKIKPPYWIHNWVDNELIMSCYHLAKNTALEYINQIKKVKPEIVYAYPSAMYLLAKYFYLHNEKYQFKAIFTSSELLRSDQREFIESVFNCKIYDEYGQGERVSKITQCREGNYHINEDYSIVELIDTPKGLEIVGTTFNNFAMPLLRYRTGDIVECSVEKCNCGSSFRLIKGIQGRALESTLFYTKDGVNIIAYDQIPTGVNNLIETQFVQEKLDEIIINIVTGNDFSHKDEQKLLLNSKEKFPLNTKIIINKVTEIKRGPNGKFNNVVIKLSSQEKGEIVNNA